jgi:hypothetical protein
MEKNKSNIKRNIKIIMPVIMIMAVGIIWSFTNSEDKTEIPKSKVVGVGSTTEKQKEENTIKPDIVVPKVALDVTKDKEVVNRDKDVVVEEKEVKVADNKAVNTPDTTVKKTTTTVKEAPIVVKKAPVVVKKTPIVVKKAPVVVKPVVKVISSGFKDNLVNDFYVGFHETASTFNHYFGVKHSVFKGYLKAVASGQMSKSTCISKIKSVGKWEENLALPYQTKKQNMTIWAGPVDYTYHVNVYETTDSNMDRVGGYMYQNGLLTTGDYYECSVYYDANIKKYRVVLIGIPLIYQTRND